ncbi:MAG: MFS transporter, partial [Sphingomonadales bacterium]
MPIRIPAIPAPMTRNFISDFGLFCTASTMVSLNDVLGQARHAARLRKRALQTYDLVVFQQRGGPRLNFDGLMPIPYEAEHIDFRPRARHSGPACFYRYPVLDSAADLRLSSPRDGRRTAGACKAERLMALQAVGDQGATGGATEMTLTAREEFRAYWKVVAASFVGLMFGAWALPLYLLGPFSKSFETALGWERSDIVIATTFLAVGGTLGTPVIGYIVDRYAPRMVALASLLVIALSLGAFSLIDGSVLELHLLYFAMGFLGAGSGGVSFTRAIGAWFRKGRGFALGIALCGTGAAAFAAPLFGQYFIALFGWRGASLCIAALIIVVAMPIVAWGLRTPKVTELSPRAPGPDLHGVSRAEAIRDPRFYI